MIHIIRTIPKPWLVVLAFLVASVVSYSVTVAIGVLLGEDLASRSASIVVGSIAAVQAYMTTR